MEKEEDTASRLHAHGIAAERLEAPFPLWLVRARDGGQGALLDILSDAENARADRFTLERLARRYRAAHGALRLLVEAGFGVPAARQRYGLNDHGKPHLLDLQHVQCNMSYSGDYAVVALATGAEIGIDIEQVRRIEDAAELADLHYTEAEVAGISADRDADRAFLSVWVRKEACVKALGKGLSIAPSSFECGVGCGPRDVLIEKETVESDVVDPKGGFLLSWARKARLEY